MTIPLSTSITTNEYIDQINSAFNFQLAELTVFQFPDTEKCKQIIYTPLKMMIQSYLVTVSCEISLSPKQTADQYKLSNCNVPARTSGISFVRKRRDSDDVLSQENISKMTISRTIDTFSRRPSEASTAFEYHLLSVSLCIATLYLL